MRVRTLRLALTAAVLVVGVVVALLAGTGGSDGGGAGSTATTGAARPRGATTAATTHEDGAASTLLAPEVPAARAGGLELVALSALPDEAAATWRLVLEDGPFPFDRDGATFENREGILPARPRGHYREYTVPTPGEEDRGARRLVVGGDATDVGEQGGRSGAAVFYTDDHYASFVEVDPGT